MTPQITSRRPFTRRPAGLGGGLAGLALLVGLVAALVPQPVAAQGVIEGRDEIDFDRPEAWALKYFAEVTRFTAVGPPRRLAAGDVELGFELGWIPKLDEDQRRVGFNGTKVEDLNKTPVLPRPRLKLGLGRGWALDLGYLPPIEVNGVRSNLLSVAVERPLLQRERWSLGLRAMGQLGHIEGDFTCSAEDASIPPGDPGNDFGCEEPSGDTATLDGVGLTVLGGMRLGDRGGSLHVGLAAVYNELEFQVDALTYGVRDRTLLLTDGWTYSLTAGVSWPLGERFELGGELYYSPLDVRRSVDAAVENDGLLNIRAIVRYRL